MFRRKIKGDRGMIISIPKGILKNQYLWFGDTDGRYIGSLSHKAKLKKLKRWIEEIISDS